MQCHTFIFIIRIWSSKGIYKSDNAGLSEEIICNTTHLTSFAVLVDPQVRMKFKCTLQGYNVQSCIYTCYITITQPLENTAGQKALGIVSYIGCIISLGCLLTSLFIFLFFG